MTLEQAAGRASFTTHTGRFQLWAERALERARDWSHRLPGLGERARPHDRIGLALSAQGIALATVQQPSGGKPRLTRCEFHPLPRQSDPGLALRALMSSNAESASYRLVLNSDEYQLHLVEAPAVPDSELREAVRWRVRDLIDFPVDEAAIDVFDVPHAVGAQAERTMCVVVARNPVIAQKVAHVNRSGGEIDVIDIADLALRNLLALTPADATGVALLHVEPTYSLILIAGGSTLYLSRRIWIGQQDLATIAGKGPDDEEFRRTGDALAMELLRSLEYYESHFARPGVETVYVAPSTAVEPALHAYLAQAIALPVGAFDLGAVLDGAGSLSPELQARSLLAIGAALRQERSTL